MAQWDDGYVTDVAYTASFYREITPAWLAMTSLLLGHRPPDLTRPFAYADIGCGNGFTTLTVAATTPHADVWGFDFNPPHIEFARNLARDAELTNVHFVEASFADLAALPAEALPAFDMVAAHGVLSWISPANRAHLIGTINRRLKPGGLAYLSYNVTTGWSSMVPVRALMRMLATASAERTDAAAAGVMDFVDLLKQAGAAFFQAHPNLETRLQDMRKQDPRYLAHEYLNRDWHPLMFADVAEEMLEAKCRYIGSATLAENIDTFTVPANVAPILAEARDTLMRETIRDFSCVQTFRRDVYRKGTIPITAPEQQGLLDDLTVVWLGMPMPEAGPTFNAPMGAVTGRPEVYQPLFELLQAGPLSIRQARALPSSVDRPLVELVQAFTLLAAGGYVHPMLPDGGTDAAREASRRLNLALARAVANAIDLPQLVAPAIGSSIRPDILEVLMVGELAAGRPADANALSGEVLAKLLRGGRNVQRDGQAISDPTEMMRVLTDAITAMLERRLPILRRLGVVH